jgi:hypothetical protein
MLLNTLIVQGQQCQNPLKLKNLEGQWFIQFSNFPMWLKGNKTSPRFNYTLQGDRLFDKVEYFKKGKDKSIKGFDYPLDECNRHFEWRGKGLLCLLKSRWQIIEIDQETNWALIYFEKTLFTPEGFDVISKNKELTKNQMNSINTRISRLSVENELVPISQLDNQ